MALRIQANGQLVIKLITISIVCHKKKIAIRHCRLFESFFLFLSLNSNYLLKELLFEEFGMNLLLEKNPLIFVNLSNKFRLNVYLRDRLILVFFYQI